MPTFIKHWHLQPKLWPKDENLKIAILADPHAGWPMMPLKRLKKIVSEINALNADMIVLLGDYRARFFGRTTSIKISDVAEILSELEAPLGVYGVLGNHDWWDDKVTQRRGTGPCITTSVFENYGLCILENASVEIDGRFNLVGLGDQCAFGRTTASGVHDLDLALKNINPKLPTILLAHEPDIFEDIPNSIALTLSGHTHGGQLNLFGWTPIAPSRLSKKYIYGHYNTSKIDLIVSAGLGYSGLPLRIGRPSEITLIELG